MSIKVIDAVFANSKARGAARLVLLAIADHCNNDDGSGAWPSYTRLMQRTNLSREGVAEALKTLKAIGELEVVKGSSRASNAYRVRVEQSAALTSQQSRPQRSAQQTSGVYPGRREPYSTRRNRGSYEPREELTVQQRRAQLEAQALGET